MFSIGSSHCPLQRRTGPLNVLYRILPLPTTEENKSMEHVTRILEEVHKFGIDRRSEPLIAIGAGVCLDVVGLAVSFFRRTTPYIRVPTTLLFYIDASVGAKTGVNFVNGMNKLGSYITGRYVFRLFLAGRFLLGWQKC
jgi:3-dehydroquinate synthetase